MCTPTAQLTDLAKEILVKEVGYGIVRIGDLSVYAPDDTPQHKLTMENVVYGGKIASTVQSGPIPIQSTSHLLFKREQCIAVSDSHFFTTPHTGHADLPYQVLPEWVTMTDDGFVFPTDMPPPDMERHKRSMKLTGSVVTKFEPLYELGDGTPMFTFLVKPTESSPSNGGMGSVAADVKMEYDDGDMTQHVPPDSELPVSGGESPGGCRAVAPGKKQRTSTCGSAASTKSTSTKSRKPTGVGIAKALDFSGQRTTIVLAPRARALQVLKTARRTASWRVFHQEAHGPVMTDRWPSELFHICANRSASAALRNSTTY
jgi:hypothetical protein